METPGTVLRMPSQALAPRVGFAARRARFWARDPPFRSKSPAEGALTLRMQRGRSDWVAERQSRPRCVVAVGDA